MSLNPPIRDWQGQVVWLVGASSGIGQAIAHALHARGAKVRVSARSEAALNTFCSNHPGSVALPLDVTDAQQVRAAFDRIKQGDGRIDLMLYCAGHYHPMRATSFDLADALRHQRVNVDGALHALDAVMPTMLRQGYGHISLVASVAGYRGLPQSLAYGPTKAALQHLADTLYLDLHEQGLGVSVINPGFVSTPLTQKNDFEMPALLTPDQAAEATLAGWAQGRYEIHFPKRFTLWLKLLQLLPHRLYFWAVRRVTGV
ncbi:MAG: SDR family NAD(P)-dependent oxidoreductase [Aquabacterium sp.]|uniref:SDR family NAD(P)-dependent oxidoreductase n=1 Tax=Aquabacterium sp. TaxID=1872578 RepID=UPI0012213658|nr:SDR family NAD(P)-dependent oxidoreductase [Aquabacterium sp.]TAK95956.1 MAG: SDR family NAD(P)-dependent oxidoreductase [Aquabacterium sp.]